MSHKGTQNAGVKAPPGAWQAKCGGPGVASSCLPQRARARFWSLDIRSIGMLRYGTFRSIGMLRYGRELS
jgi:hypothetical protein